MKKAFGQTVRDLKREVNKKVLKVPGIEQKVLDATSNEPWGPHGSLLADIAHASKNYNDYQMIMTVIWKRINDTGKNWRHVYKGLTVLEYLVAHGSERVIEEIKEHAYQISTLSDFQYIDSSGKDQGSNVRKKSQSLVLLVNDKERILEVRQKAAANRDKFRNTASTGGMYRPSSYSSSGGYGERYDDDRYGSREDDRNGYGREREGSNRDDDRYGKLGDNSGRDGDRYGRDYEERYGRDGYRDDDYQGRSRSVDDYNSGPRSRSSDRDRNHGYDDDANSSSRGSGARADEHSQDGRRLDRKFSEQNLGAPPSYEEAVNDARSPVQSERGGETSAASAPKPSSPPASTSPSQATTGHAPTNQGVDTFDEFDPRGPNSAAPNTSNGAEMDLLGSLSESFSSNALAIVPTIPATASSETDAFAISGSGSTYSATSSAVNQPFEDPFGDSPFKATSSWESGVPAQPSSFPSTTSFHPARNQISEQDQPFAPKVDEVSNFSFGETFPGISYTSSANAQLPSTNPQFMSQEMSPPNQDIDILADILPPSGPSPFPSSQPTFPSPVGQPAQPNTNVPERFYPESGSTAPVASYFAPQASSGPGAQNNSGFFPQSGYTDPLVSNMTPQAPAGTTAQHNGASFLQHSGSTAPVGSHMSPQEVGPTALNNTGSFLPQSGSAAPVAHQTSIEPVQNNNVLGGLLPQVGPTNSMNSRPSNPASMGQLAIVPQPSKDKFETKSTVWADTLNRGLVNLNISGSKTNPLADIGIDFEAINRKEKRMEKPSAAPLASNITMGKAMGSGSGIGRAGAIRPSPNPMMGAGMGGAPGAGMGMGMGGAPGAGMGMGMGMGGAPGAGMGMGMGMGGAPGAGMGMGMGGAPGAGMGMGMGGAPGAGMGMGMGMGMGSMGMGGAPGAGMGMGGYGGMNQPMGVGMGMNMGMNMGQGPQMQPPAGTGMPPGSTMPGGYNPMMGAGGYAPQPYGGGYR